MGRHKGGPYGSTIRTTGAIVGAALVAAHEDIPYCIVSLTKLPDSRHPL